METTLAQGRYAVLACIGQGGSADVYSVVDEKLGLERAVKVPRERPDAADAERLRREAAVLLRLDHPCILRVFDTFDHDGRPCLVMERCQGSLEERVQREGPLSPDEALALGENLRSALAAVHAAGVLHRDVKPANVLFTVAGQPRLADFGVALTQRDPTSLTRTGAVLGTVAFMAPAVRRGEPGSEATDRYGLAATVAFAVMGSLPGDVDRSSVQKRLPAPVASWIQGLLMVDGHEADAGAAAASGTSRPIWAIGAGLLGLGLAVGAVLGRGTWPAPEAGAAPTAREPSAAAASACDGLPIRANWQSAPGLRETVGADFLDITRDGHPDAVYVSQQDEVLQVLPGGPGATVETRIDIPVGRAAVPPTLLDLDQDGSPELILPERDEAQLRVIWLGPDLHPARTELLEQAGPMEHAQAFDIDGDGLDDLVGAIDFGRHLVWRRVAGDGTLEPQRYLLNVRGVTIRAMLGRDLLVEDEQGAWTWRRLDVEQGFEQLSTVPADSVLLELPDGVAVIERATGLLRRHDQAPCHVGDLARYLNGGGGVGLRVADWNADGKLDVLASRTCRGCTSELMVGLGL